jgi:hypothetical protein
LKSKLNTKKIKRVKAKVKGSKNRNYLFLKIGKRKKLKKWQSLNLKPNLGLRGISNQKQK